MRIALVAGLLLLTAAAAYAQFLNQPMPMVPYSGQPGVNVPNSLTGPMVSNAGQIGGGGGPPAGCVGAADFSDGCAIAVFGH